MSDGDILDIPTQVEQAFVDGRQIDLHDRHKMLYARYRQKYRQLGLGR